MIAAEAVCDAFFQIAVSQVCDFDSDLEMWRCNLAEHERRFIIVVIRRKMLETINEFIHLHMEERLAFYGVAYNLVQFESDHDADKMRIVFTDARCVYHD